MNLLENIKKRYYGIINELGMDLSLENEFKIIRPLLDLKREEIEKRLNTLRSGMFGERRAQAKKQQIQAMQEWMGGAAND